MDRDKFVQNNMQAKYDYLIQKGHDVAAIFVQGSQNYELDTYTEEYTSDVDCKAWVIPSLENLILGHKPISTTIVMENNEHIDVKDIRLVVPLLMASNPTYVELVNSKFHIVTEEFMFFVKNRHKVSMMNRGNLINAILGTFYNKKKDLRHKFPTRIDLIDKHGYDPKQFHHMFRLLVLAERLYVYRVNYGKAMVVKGKTKKHLLALKFGDIPNDEVDILVKSWEDRMVAIRDMVAKQNYVPNVKLKKQLDEIVNNVLLEKVYQSSKEVLIKRGDL